MRQLIRISTLVWSIAWFALVVPGHTRGIIMLPVAAPVAPSCHADAATPSCHPKPTCCDEPCEEPRDSDPVRHCAVCDLVAKLNTPIVIDLSLPPAGLVELLPASDPQTVTPTRHVSPNRDRAPPTV